MRRTDPLKNLVRVQKERAALREEYNWWLGKAVEDGYSNNKIAKALGVSETAIRNYRKRNEL